MGRCEGCCVTRTAIAACPRSRAGLPVPETRRSLAAPAAARDCAGRLWPVERPCGALAVSVARLRGNRLRRYSPSSDSSWEPSSSPLSRPSPRFQARRAGAADSRSRTLLLRSGRIESILARAPDRLDQVPLAHPRSSGDVLSLGDLVELLAVSILQLPARLSAALATLRRCLPSSLRVRFGRFAIALSPRGALGLLDGSLRRPALSRRSHRLPPGCSSLGYPPPAPQNRGAFVEQGSRRWPVETRVRRVVTVHRLRLG
jgi:hypothetical protein